MSGEGDALKEILDGWAEIVDEADEFSWVKVTDEVAFSSGAPKLKEYLEAERELTGNEWLDAVFSRREGYVREDLATDTAFNFVKSSAYPPLDRSPGKNWVESKGGLPKYIERIAKHVHYEAGRPIGMAIAIAVSTVKKWCAGGEVHQFPGIQRLKPESRAQACNAVRQWESMKARKDK